MKKTGVILINLVLVVVAWKVITRHKHEPEAVEIKKRSVIEKFDFEEAKTIKLPKGDYLGIELAQSGESFWIGNGKKLQLIDAKTIVLNEIVLPEKILALTVVSDELIYVVGKRTIYQVRKGKNGFKTTSWQRGISRSHFTSVCADKEKIYVCDAGSKMVFAYNQSDGKRVWASSGMRKFEVPKPWFQVGFNPEGELWVVNPGRQVCEQLDPQTGRYKSFWKPEKKSFIGCCDPALMRAVSGGRFVIMVKRLLKLRFYTPAGKKESLVTDMRRFDPGKFSYDMTVGSDETVYILDDRRDQIRCFKKLPPVEESVEEVKDAEKAK